MVNKKESKDRKEGDGGETKVSHENRRRKG